MINCAESVGSSSISICSSPSNENGLRTPSAGAKMLVPNISNKHFSLMSAF